MSIIISSVTTLKARHTRNCTTFEVALRLFPDELNAAAVANVDVGVAARAAVPAARGRVRRRAGLAAAAGHAVRRAARAAPAAPATPARAAPAAPVDAGRLALLPTQ